MALKIILVIVAYLIGAINMATIIGKLKGKNIKKLGSGNPGTMNVMRSIGKGWGALTFAFDCAKGVGFALLGKYAIGSDEWMFILGAVAVIGHIFPIYTKFKGGKGVATSLGMFMVATPIVGPCVFVALIIYLLVCKIGFIGSYLAITALTVTNCIKYRSSVVSIIFTLIVWLLVILRHKDNVKRFIQGKENTLSIVGKNEVKELDVEQDGIDEQIPKVEEDDCSEIPAVEENIVADEVKEEE